MTSASDVSVPVFDVGGVLLDWDPRHLYRSIFATNTEVEDFLGQVCLLDWNRQMDEGKPFRQAVAERISAFPEWESAIRAFDERWQEMVAGPIAGTVACLQALKAEGHAVYAISNFSAEKFALERQRWDFLALFDGIVLSAEIGVLKPDPGIYEHFLQIYQVPAQSCLFIDDRPENVAAAEALGMVGHLFETPDALREDLERVGLLPGDPGRQDGTAWR